MDYNILNKFQFGLHQKLYLKEINIKFNKHLKMDIVLLEFFKKIFLMIKIIGKLIL